MVRVPHTSRTPTPRCCLHLTPISRPSRSLLLVAKGWCITRGSLERKEIAIAAVSVAALYAAVSVQLSLGSVISLVPMVSYLKLPEATALPGHTPRGAIVHATRLEPAGADVSIDACEHFPLHRGESARAQGAGLNPLEQVGPDSPPKSRAPCVLRTDARDPLVRHRPAHHARLQEVLHVPKASAQTCAHRWQASLVRACSAQARGADSSVRSDGAVHTLALFGGEFVITAHAIYLLGEELVAVVCAAHQPVASYGRCRSSGSLRCSIR